MIELKYMKKGCVTVLVTCLVVMILKYSLVTRHLERYFNTILLKYKFSTENHKIHYNENDLKSIESSFGQLYLNKATEKVPSISKCGYNVCFTIKKLKYYLIKIKFNSK